MKHIRSLLFLLLLFSLFPSPVSAHAFGASYTLPIPFWLYSFTGAAALLLSFLLVGFFISGSHAKKSFPQYRIGSNAVVSFLTSESAVRSYQLFSLFLFLLTILSGLIGEDLSSYNFNMTFFWVIFVLGFTYLTFLIGNIWDCINPWKTLTALYESLLHTKVKGVIPYPEQFGYYPAFIFYVLFISIELIIGTSPFSLSVILIQYTAITFTAVFLYGKDSWFRYGEFFSVFFRFISYASPLVLEKSSVYLRLPFVGLIDKKATDFSMLLFILFMLSSTAFDGFRETTVWVDFYWIYLKGLNNQVVEIIALIASPFFFLGLYLLVIFLMQRIVHTKLSIKELAFIFAFSLLPIALVYNIAHYFTLFLIQGQEIIRLISDPFGWYWNIFGTAGFKGNAGIVSAAAVWHTQVALILIGHIVSVIIAHYIALSIFPKHKEAVISQLPMLLLMVIYTIIGLWILSQPIALR